MRKAVAYYRVSTGGQGEKGNGLSAQRRTVREYCKQNNITLEKEFIEVKSAEEDHNRPKVQLAVNYCLKHDMELIVSKQHRLARSVLFIAMLIKRKLKFFSVAMPYANNFQKYLQAAIDEQFLDDLKSNTKMALQSVVNKGGKLGGNPAKLKRTLRRQRKDYLRVIKPVFKQILKQYSTVRDITNELNRLRIKTFRGKRGGWHVSTVHKTLNDLSPNK